MENPLKEDPTKEFVGEYSVAQIFVLQGVAETFGRMKLLPFMNAMIEFDLKDVESRARYASSPPSPLTKEWNVFTIHACPLFTGPTQWQPTLTSSPLLTSSFNTTQTTHGHYTVYEAVISKLSNTEEYYVDKPEEEKEMLDFGIDQAIEFFALPSKEDLDDLSKPREVQAGVKLLANKQFLAV